MMKWWKSVPLCVSVVATLLTIVVSRPPSSSATRQKILLDYENLTDIWSSTDDPLGAYYAVADDGAGSYTSTADEFVEVSMKATNLSEHGVNACQIYMRQTVDNRTEWILIHNSKPILPNVHADFLERPLLPYSFHEKQMILFRMIDSEGKHQNYLDSVECSLGELITRGVMNLSLRRQQQMGGQMTNASIAVTVEKFISNRDKVHLTMAGDVFTKRDRPGPSNPFIEIYVERAQSYELVYKTEVSVDTSEPVWNPAIVTVRKLCDGDQKRSLKFVCWNLDGQGGRKLVGEFQTTLEELRLQTRGSFTLKNQFENDRIMGQVDIIDFQYFETPTLAEFIRGGLQIHGTIAIDFSVPNDSRMASSLHRYDPIGASFNSYEETIKSAIGIIEDYSWDKRFNVFGFGARHRHSQMSYFQYFIINPPNGCIGVQGILDAYRHCFSSVQAFMQPTALAPHIQYFAQTVRSINNEDRYFVLLIFANGAIPDINETRNVINDALDLPVSILIVGVGHASFESMMTLNDCGAQVQRKIVKVVPFYQFSSQQFNAYNNNQTTNTLLAKELLADIPNQVVSFMHTHGYMPKPPNFDHAIFMDHVNYVNTQPTFDLNSLYNAANYSGGVPVNPTVYQSQTSGSGGLFHQPPNNFPPTPQYGNVSSQQSFNPYMFPQGPNLSQSPHFPGNPTTTSWYQQQNPPAKSVNSQNPFVRPPPPSSQMGVQSLNQPMSQFYTSSTNADYGRTPYPATNSDPKAVTPMPSSQYPAALTNTGFTFPHVPPIASNNNPQAPFTQPASSFPPAATAQDASSTRHMPIPYQPYPNLPNAQAPSTNAEYTQKAQIGVQSTGANVPGSSTSSPSKDNTRNPFAQPTTTFPTAESTRYDSPTRNPQIPYQSYPISNPHASSTTSKYTQRTQIGVQPTDANVPGSSTSSSPSNDNTGNPFAQPTDATFPTAEPARYGSPPRDPQIPYQSYSNLSNTQAPSTTAEYTQRTQIGTQSTGANVPGSSTSSSPSNDNTRNPFAQPTDATFPTAEPARYGSPARDPQIPYESYSSSVNPSSSSSSYGPSNDNTQARSPQPAASFPTAEPAYYGSPSRDPQIPYQSHSNLPNPQAPSTAAEYTQQTQIGIHSTVANRPNPSSSPYSSSSNAEPTNPIQSSRILPRSAEPSSPPNTEGTLRTDFRNVSLASENSIQSTRPSAVQPTQESTYSPYTHPSDNPSIPTAQTSATSPNSESEYNSSPKDMNTAMRGPESELFSELSTFFSTPTKGKFNVNPPSASSSRLGSVPSSQTLANKEPTHTYFHDTSPKDVAASRPGPSAAQSTPEVIHSSYQSTDWKDADQNPSPQASSYGINKESTPIHFYDTGPREVPVVQYSRNVPQFSFPPTDLKDTNQASSSQPSTAPTNTEFQHTSGNTSVPVNNPQSTRTYYDSTKPGDETPSKSSQPFSTRTTAGFEDARRPLSSSLRANSSTRPYYNRINKESTHNTYPGDTNPVDAPSTSRSAVKSVDPSAATSNADVPSSSHASTTLTYSESVQNYSHPESQNNIAPIQSMKSSSPPVTAEIEYNSYSSSTSTSSASSPVSQPSTSRATVEPTLTPSRAIDSRGVTPSESSQPFSPATTGDSIPTLDLRTSSSNTSPVQSTLHPAAPSDGQSSSSLYPDIG